MTNYNKPNKGSGGGEGSSIEFLSGSGAPTADKGKSGDVYINTTNGDLYKNTAGTWGKIMNLKGAKGDKGDTGAQGIQGDKGDTGAPGFGTEAQYNDIIQRLTALENAGGA